MVVIALLMSLLGFTTCLMGATVAINYLRKLASGQPGLIANEDGITDHSTLYSFGLVEWSDVTRIHVERLPLGGLMSTCVLVHVGNTWKYFSRINPVSRAGLRSSPVGALLVISTTWLDGRAENIGAELEERWRQYQRDNPRDRGSPPTFRPSGWDIKR
jgi:hypothetical protein